MAKKDKAGENVVDNVALKKAVDELKAQQAKPAAKADAKTE
jgi:hypothetical protein